MAIGNLTKAAAILAAVMLTAPALAEEPLLQTLQCEGFTTTRDSKTGEKNEMGTMRNFTVEMRQSSVQVTDGYLGSGMLPQAFEPLPITKVWASAIVASNDFEMAEQSLGINFRVSRHSLRFQFDHIWVGRESTINGQCYIGQPLI